MSRRSRGDNRKRSWLSFSGPVRFGVVWLCMSVVAPSAHAALMGDVDGDSRVTVKDAVRVLQGTLGARKWTARDRLLGDVSPANPSSAIVARRWTRGDGILDEADVAGILRVAIGMIPERDIGPVVYDVAGSGITILQMPKNVLKKDPERFGDGRAEEITLFDPYDLAIAPNGDVFFTEYQSGRIRVLKPDGTVRTLAGNVQPGFQDGRGDDAQFKNPMGIALLPSGDLIVADAYNNAIRKVTLDGEVTTLAGNGRPGAVNATGAEASFRAPNGVATDPDGNVYVADTGNNLLRKISPDGKVVTLAGSGQPGLEDGYVRMCRFYLPAGVTYDPLDGGVYVADMGNHAIRKFSAKTGYVVTLAGDSRPGWTDGEGSNAKFTAPYGMDLDTKGNLWIADWKSGLMRVMDPSRKVVTKAGVPPDGGYLEGPALEAQFTGLMNVRCAPNGFIYLADTDNERIRIYAP